MGFTKKELIQFMDELVELASKENVKFPTKREKTLKYAL